MVAHYDKISADRQERGVFLIPTTQAILIAEVSPVSLVQHQYDGQWLTYQYDTPIPAGDANIVVSKLGDYLKSVGY
jgi:profilin